MDRAKGLDPCPSFMHIHVRQPERAGPLRKKGCATVMRQQLALPELRAVRLITASRLFDPLSEVMSMHRSGKSKWWCAPFGPALTPSTAPRTWI